MSGFERLGIPENRHPRQVYYGAVGKTLRHVAFELPIAVEAAKAIFVYVDPGRGTAKGLHSWAAAHRRHKIAPSRSRSTVTAPCRRKVIRDSIRVGVKGISCRSGGVNRTCGVDSQKAVPTIHKDVFPDLFASQSVTAIFPASPCRSGRSEVDGSDPPLLPPGSARRQAPFSHAHVPPGRVAPVQNIPGGKARNDTGGVAG